MSADDIGGITPRKTLHDPPGDIPRDPPLNTPGNAPARALERIVGILTPPACREVVLGDLRERYRSTLHYISDAWYAIPCVVYSRVRRTADPGVLLMDAMLLYLSFFAAAWEFDRELLYQEFGLARLAIPAALALVVLILADAYAKPGKPSAMRPVMHAMFGVGLMGLAQTWFAAAGFAFALPEWIVIAGGVFGVIGISIVGMLFPKDDHRPRGA